MFTQKKLLPSFMNIKQVYQTGVCSPGENIKWKSIYSLKKNSKTKKIKIEVVN